MPQTSHIITAPTPASTQAPTPASTQAPTLAPTPAPTPTSAENCSQILSILNQNVPYTYIDGFGEHTVRANGGTCGVESYYCTYVGVGLKMFLPVGIEGCPPSIWNIFGDPNSIVGWEYNPNPCGYEPLTCRPLEKEQLVSKSSICTIAYDNIPDEQSVCVEETNLLSPNFKTVGCAFCQTQQFPIIDYDVTIFYVDTSVSNLDDPYGGMTTATPCQTDGIKNLCSCC